MTGNWPESFCTGTTPASSKNMKRRMLKSHAPFRSAWSSEWFKRYRSVTSAGTRRGDVALIAANWPG
jgi:hypothetical protein